MTTDCFGKKCACVTPTFLTLGYPWFLVWLSTSCFFTFARLFLVIDQFVDALNNVLISSIEMLLFHALFLGFHLKNRRFHDHFFGFDNFNAPNFICILQVEITGVIYAESVGKLGIDDVWFSNGCHITGIVN